MFTGIVQMALPVVAIDAQPQLHQITLRFPQPLLDGLVTGASVALNGTCLTVVSIKGDEVAFDMMMETLRLTNLGALSVGDRVNVERAARFDSEIGGHLLSGHVHTQVRVSQIEYPENNRVIHFELPEEWRDYILPKGYVALNGCSLTVSEEVAETFCVYLIPETLNITTFGTLAVGDKINLEVDSQTQAVVDTVKSLAKSGRLAGWLDRA